MKSIDCNILCVECACLTPAAITATISFCLELASVKGTGTHYFWGHRLSRCTHPRDAYSPLKYVPVPQLLGHPEEHSHLLSRLADESLNNNHAAGELCPFQVVEFLKIDENKCAIVCPSKIASYRRFLAAPEYKNDWNQVLPAMNVQLPRKLASFAFLPPSTPTWDNPLSKDRKPDLRYEHSPAWHANELVTSLLCILTYVQLSSSLSIQISVRLLIPWEVVQAQSSIVVKTVHF